MRILIVDDSRSSLAFLKHVVGDLGFADIECMLHPADALRRADEVQFDLVLVDNIMPDIDGVELTRLLRARADYRLVPVIMVTSIDDPQLRVTAIAAGATDFIHKPFDVTELQARVRNLVALRQAQIELADQAQWLAREVEIATRHLVAREEEIIWRLARAIEYRDGDTGEHVSRVAQMSRIIAEGIGLGAERCRCIYLAAPLHDIGKIGIADAILSKPGRLTPDELATMRQHVSIGARILEDGSSEIIRTAELIAQSEPAAARWRIRFHLPSDALLYGTNPVLLLGEIAELGPCQVTALTDGLPTLEELDVEGSYLGCGRSTSPIPIQPQWCSRAAC